MTEEMKATKLKPAEIVAKIVELGKQGVPAEKIGLILRDQHGVPKAKVFGKKIGKVLKENDIPANSEYNNINNKVETLKKHFEKNRHDYSAKKSLITYNARLTKMNRRAAAKSA